MRRTMLGPAYDISETNQPNMAFSPAPPQPGIRPASEFRNISGAGESALAAKESGLRL